MGLENQIVSKEASKEAAKYLFSSDDGVQARKRAGILSLVIGIVWILIILGANWIATIAPEPNPMPMKVFIVTIGIGVFFILFGLIQLVLIKTSAKFREWANKDYERDLIKIGEMKENTSQELKIILIYFLVVALVVGLIVFLILL